MVEYTNKFDVVKPPRLSTMAIDLEAFNEQRKQFWENYHAFRKGNFNSGQGASDRLISMYNILPACRHFIIDEPAALEFLARINAFSTDLRNYNKVKTPSTPESYEENMQKFYAELDAIIRDFHKIMYRCGYSK